MDFKPIAVDDAHLTRLGQLFRAAFPTAHHLDAGYLRWLYRDNPSGHVVGFDAFEGDVLAAHYACVPAEVRWKGNQVRALLSLNTATHPNFQGKGLFSQLATATFDHAAQSGFTLVYG